MSDESDGGRRCAAEDCERPMDHFIHGVLLDGAIFDVPTCGRHQDEEIATDGGADESEFAVGQRVVSNREFSGVPEGTEGVVDEDYGPGIMVAWDLPEKPLPDGYDRKPEDELRPMTTDPDGFSVPILRDGFDKETELRFLDPVDSPVPDGGQPECTDMLCSNEAEYALLMGDHFSRVRDPPEALTYGDGDLHPHVCKACLPRYQSHYGGHGEFVRPEHHDSQPVPDEHDDEFDPSVVTDGGEEEWSPSCWDCDRELPRRRLNMFPVHIDNEDGLGYEVVDVPLCDECRKDRMPTHECPRCGEEYLHLDRATECCPDYHEFAPVPDGGRESRRFVLDSHRHVSYGPTQDGDHWTLTFTDDEIGRVELLLDEDAMYELWIEVSDVPFPRDGTEAGDLRREVVHETSGMDAEMLREVLERVEEVNRGQW